MWLVAIILNSEDGGIFFFFYDLFTKNAPFSRDTALVSSKVSQTKMASRTPSLQSGLSGYVLMCPMPAMH